MRHLKLTGIICLAAFTATLAIANSALAFPLPSVLPGQNTWKGKAPGKTLFSTVGTNPPVECATATGTGTLELPTKTLGEFHITFGGCKATGTTFVCTGTSDTAGSGTILSLGSWHSVVDVNSPELHAAILFLPNETKFKCSIVETVIMPGGMVLCLVNKPLESKASHEFLCETIKSEGKDTGKPVETEYFNDNGEKVKIKPLTVSVSGGAAVEASQEGTGTVEFVEAQKIDD
jgi:hypothetical protein